MPRLRIQHQAVPEPATHRDIRTQRPFLHVLRAIVSGCRLDSCRSSRTRSPGRYGQRASCLRFNCPMRRRRCCEHLAKAVSYPVEQGLVQPVCFKVSRSLQVRLGCPVPETTQKSFLWITVDPLGHLPLLCWFCSPDYGEISVDSQGAQCSAIHI